MGKFSCAFLLLAASASASWAQGLELRVDRSNPTVAVSIADFDGSAALRALDISGEQQLDPLVLLTGTRFRNGSIEAEVAGKPAPGAASDVRGFIGIAFRVQADRERYEAFYIRPTNGRADDQLRRNHSTQYISMPDYTWQRLRREHPGVYESYADMAAGEWTKIRIEVDGARARLFVGDARQPSLIVNDLKLGSDAEGAVALWIGTGTEGYFRKVRVTPRR